MAKKNDKSETQADCGCPHTPNSSNHHKTINLAIQGGGAHGAFAWGVMDKLIEDGRLKIDGLCGTSAGAMNAVVFAYGNMIGGADGAREALQSERFRGRLQPFKTNTLGKDAQPVDIRKLLVSQLVRNYQQNVFALPAQSCQLQSLAECPCR